MPDPGFPDPSAAVGGFGAIFGIIAFLVVAGIVVTIIVAVVNAKKVVDSGHNPLTLQTDLELKVLDSAALAPASAASTPAAPAPAKTLEQRLDELQDLHARGVITDDELAAARAKVLAG